MNQRISCFALIAALSACAPHEEAEAPASLTSELTEIDACGYEGCLGPHHPAAGLEFGDLLMGAPIERIPAQASESLGDCVHQPLPGDGPVGLCSFVIDGVTYVVNGGKVVMKSIEVARPPAAGLPFALRGDEGPEEVLAALRTSTVVPMISETLPGGGVVTVRNADTLRNERGAPMRLDVLFTSDGRMTSILMQDVSAPSD
jgi:hypothetical protein